MYYITKRTSTCNSLPEAEHPFEEFLERFLIQAPQHEPAQSVRVTSEFALQTLT